MEVVGLVGDDAALNGLKVTLKQKAPKGQEDGGDDFFGGFDDDFFGGFGDHGAAKKKQKGSEEWEVVFDNEALWKLGTLKSRIRDMVRNLKLHLSSIAGRMNDYRAFF